MCLMMPRLLRGTMMKTMLWSSFIMLIIASVQGAVNPPVDIEPRGQVAVRIGDKLEIMCRLGIPIEFCRAEIPGEPSMMMKFGAPPEDGIEYYGKGPQTGECGIRIHKVKESHNGTFKCGIITSRSRTEVHGTVEIVVAIPPKTPELILSPGSIGRNKYKNSEKLSISCSASSGRPPANVSLYLDNVPLGNELSTGNFRLSDLERGEQSLAVQNVSYALKWSDNGKTVRCVADHIALDHPKEITRMIEVFYPPQQEDDFEQFGYVIGRPGAINVTVRANPRPRFVWSVNDEKIDEDRFDSSKRLESHVDTQGNAEYIVKLKIDSVQKSDTEKEYVLEAHNDQGTAVYRIKLSTSTEPEGFDIDAGYIIGIVIGVLVLLLLIFIIIFARATGRWCFAGGSTTRNIGESDIADPAASIRLLRFHKPKNDDANSAHRSDTESAGRYSRTEVDSTPGRPRRPKMALSQLFRRNKDKVSGADTDTMRTIVSIDDEKIPEATEQSEKPNQPSETGLVYAELDLAKREIDTTPRRVSDDKTEYAEILYTKPEEEVTNPENK